MTSAQCAEGKLPGLHFIGVVTEIGTMTLAFQHTNHSQMTADLATLA